MHTMTPKPHLTVVLGAGASVGLGVPSTGDLTTKLWAALDQIKGTQSLLPWDESPSRVLRACLDAEYTGANFELVLHALEALHSLNTTWSPGTAPAFRVVEGVLAGGPRGNLRDVFADRRWIDAATRRLFEVIHEEISRASATVTTKPAWADVAPFLRQLDATFDLHVVTLNYDDIVEQALGWGGTEQGFARIAGQTVEHFVAYRAPPRLIHLHGSLTFGYGTVGSSGPMHEVYLHPTPQSARDSLAIIRSQPNSQSGRHTIVGPIITGMQKADKLQAEPYETYYRHAGNLLAMHPRLLVAGFGFGDRHISSLIGKMRRVHGADRRVVIVDFDSGHGHDDGEWGGMSKCWGSTRSRDEIRSTIQELAGERDPFGEFTYWRSWTSDDDRLRVHLCGLNDIASNYAADVIAFLKKP